MEDPKKSLGKLEKIKYPLLILIIGLVFLLMPFGSGGKQDTPDADARLREVLSSTEGVGQAQVLISDTGVVVVCRGAENPKVRLDIIRAVGSYTGFGSDKITVLKLAESS